MIKNSALKAIVDQLYYKIRTTPKNKLKEQFINKLVTLLVKREDVYFYLEFILSLVQKEQPYAEVVETLHKKINLAYPKWYERPIIKHMYGTVHKRFTSSTSGSIYDSLEPFLTKTDRMIFRATPNDINAIQAVYLASKTDGKLKGIVVKSLRMPLLYFGAIIGFANFFQEEVIVKFIDLVEKLDKQPTGALALVDSINTFITGTQHLVIPVMIVIMVAYRLTIPALTGSARTTVEKIWIIGIPFKMSRTINSGAFLRTLATLYENGVNTRNALSIMEKTSTPFMRERIQEMLRTHRAKSNDALTFNNSLFTKEVRYRLSVYFELSDPTQYMNEISDTISANIEEKISKFSTNLDGFSAIVLAAYLAVVVLATQTIQSYIN